uniref:PepSY-like domain-containing protein n=1 Tax=Alistipes sp. TaxID=1872444 RepID=UPI0040568823
MKKMIQFFVMVLGALLTLQGCEKADEVVPSSSLPVAAQSLISTHFPGAEVTQVVKDYDDGGHTYKVILSDGTYIEFAKNGTWREVQNYANGVPEGLIPAKILEYIRLNYADQYVVSIELDRDYEVRLSGGLELIFSTAGDYLRMDM